MPIEPIISATHFLIAADGLNTDTVTRGWRHRHATNQTHPGVEESARVSGREGTGASIAGDDARMCFLILAAYVFRLATEASSNLCVRASLRPCVIWNVSERCRRRLDFAHRRGQRDRRRAAASLNTRRS